MSEEKKKGDRVILIWNEELIRCIYQLLCRISSDASISDDWNLEVTVDANHGRIVLIRTYRSERQKPTDNKLIRSYQGGLRSGNYTILQIFNISQI